MGRGNVLLVTLFLCFGAGLQLLLKLPINQGRCYKTQEQLELEPRGEQLPLPAPGAQEEQLGLSSPPSQPSLLLPWEASYGGEANLMESPVI